MDSLLHRDSDGEEMEDPGGPRGDREITLGTTMILAIFFALAVFAAIFFGFGYSMGSKRNTAATPTAPPAAATAAGTSAGTLKPAAGNPVNASQSPSAHTQSGGDSPAPGSSAAHSAAASAREEAAAAKNSPAKSEPSGAPALPAADQPVVQIAAVSHQEDADLLVSTLKRRGYAVAVRTEPHDKLLHVQVGPFATRKDADAMRQRLVADGFNAIVKEPGH